ncbi:MAG TPA: signal peptidase I [Candidatus Nanopelagicales bacterium]|nr:signal peptidase I [Candidatus Nanopelagicales bacterium]
MSVAAPSSDIAPPPSRRPGRTLLVAGIVSRTWLWFVAGLVAITLVPILFGWRPFVVESGSMMPRIRVGDVVLAAPTTDADQLVGRVTVFTDPDRPDTYKTHRVIGRNADGTLVTQGDANPTPDSSTITLDDVEGLGRLLVQYAGLPLIWARTGQWLLLLLLLGSLVLAAYVVSRDQDEDEPTEPTDGDGGGAVVDLPRPSTSGGSSAIAASTPLDPGLRRAAHPARRLRVLAFAVVAGLALGLPTSAAAFSATTKNSANRWAAGNWSYTTTVTGLSPWLYWKLDETAGTSAADTSGNGRTGTYNPNANAFTRGIAGALVTDSPNLGVTLNGTTACINTSSSTTMNAPTQLTEVVWFKTTTTQGGKLFGFEMPQTGVAVAGSGGTYDRHLYMDGSGKVWFGVYNGAYFTVGSNGTLNDGAWHMAVGQLGTGGMKLWIDGVQQSSTSTNAVGETTTGWFRAGCGNLAGWGGSWNGGNSPTTNSGTAQNRPFAGSLDEISVWQSVLTPAQIASLWAAH